MYAHDKKEGIPSTVSEVTAHTIQILGVNGITDLIPEGEALPHEHDFFVEVQGRDAFTELYELKTDGMTGVQTQVKLGRYYVNDIPRGEQFVQFFASVEADGLLKVEGTFSNGKKMTCERQIENRKVATGDEEVEQGKRTIANFFENGN